MCLDQAEFDVRCGWDEQGVLQLAPIRDVVVIVDVLPLASEMNVSDCVLALVLSATVCYSPGDALWQQLFFI